MSAEIKRSEKAWSIVAPVIIGLCYAVTLLAAILYPSRRNLVGGDGLKAGWGVETCLTRHVAARDVWRFLPVLSQARLGYVRELWVHEFGEPKRPIGRGLDTLGQLRRAGYHVLAQADGELRPKHSRNSLPEDLQKVYRHVRDQARTMGDLVNVWEMPNEPDTYTIKEPPDRLVAYQKAVYLGLKDGMVDGGGKPREGGVLMGALGNYPGPWLERAAENGLFDYTDGLNMHFYGHASDFGNVIRAHRATARRHHRELPIWVTECGMKAVPRDQLEEARGREIQRRFTVTTADTAVRERVAAFFPFILVWAKDGHAMVRPDGSPFPAWNAYAEYTVRHSLESRPALNPHPQPSRVVLQWAPDLSTCVSHKVSGSYWFRDRQGADKAIKGEVIFYNFSNVWQKGSIELNVTEGIRLSAKDARAVNGRKVEIPPMEAVRLAVRCVLDGNDYRRGSVALRYIPGNTLQDGQSESRLTFDLETRPSFRRLGAQHSIAASRPSVHNFQWIWAPEPYVVTSEHGIWIGLNGVKVISGGGALEESTQFSTPGESPDPRIPPMAVTRVNGLPPLPKGFLHLRTDLIPGPSAAVRVDLVDRHGQRFSIAENFGRNWFLWQPNDIYFGYRDFQLYAWSRCLEKPDFRPEDIREIQLRFYSEFRGFCDVQMEVVAPR